MRTLPSSSGLEQLTIWSSIWEKNYFIWCTADNKKTALR